MYVPFFSYFGELAYFLLRLFIGILFGCHGAQKLFGVLGGQQASEPLMVVAGIVELVGGALVALGLVTQITAFLCAGQMATAYWMVHFPQDLWPIVNGGELALLYMFVFLYIMSRGSGRFGLDVLVGKKPPANRF